MKLYSNMGKGGEQQDVKNQSLKSKCDCNLGSNLYRFKRSTFQPIMLGVNAVFYQFKSETE